MKKKYIRISLVICSITLFVLVFAKGLSQGFDKNDRAAAIVDNSSNDKDSSDVGDPTGDDPWSELGQLVENYYDKEGVEYKGSVKLFDANGDKEKLLEQKDFEYTYFDNDYSYSFGPLQVVNKKDFVLIVNHDDKIISVSSKAHRKVKSKNILDLSAFKDMLEQQHANARVTKLGNEKVLTIDSIQDADIQAYQIFYSPEDHKIHKMVIGMIRLNSLDGGNEGQQEIASGSDEGYSYFMEINYAQARRLLLKDGEFRPETKFVVMEGKKVRLTNEFSKYTLFNSEE